MNHAELIISLDHFSGTARMHLQERSQKDSDLVGIV